MNATESTNLKSEYSMTRDPATLKEIQELEESIPELAQKYQVLDKIGEGTFSFVYKAVDLEHESYDDSWISETLAVNMVQPIAVPQLSDSESPPALIGSGGGGSGTTAANTVAQTANDTAEDTVGGDDNGSGGSGNSDSTDSPQPQTPEYEARSLKRKVENHNTCDGNKNKDCGNKHLPLVAIKRISVTSSPTRIANELKILAILTNSPHVSHMITAMRDRDQVIVVMQYLLHTDFRTFYSTCDIGTTRQYMRELLAGLEFVHKHGIIHRDIKPTNFLFNLSTGRGAIVDFGLAEFEPTEGSCVCLEGGWASSSYARLPPQAGYHKDDSRPGKRANRAGTRGFRAPEVLFKCNSQTTKVDIWSAGVILLMLLARKFPFFHSMDDSDALVEIATLFGKNAMRETALLHGCVFEASLPTLKDNGHSMKSIIKWCLSAFNQDFSAEELLAIDLLENLLMLDHRCRVSAADSLHHPFLNLECR